MKKETEEKSGAFYRITYMLEFENLVQWKIRVVHSNEKRIKFDNLIYTVQGDENVNYVTFR